MAERSHFSLAGIPVRVEPAFFIIIALLGINPVDPEPIYIASWVAIAFVSILLHELGHAIAFRAYGVSPSITLHGFGGLTSGSGDLTPARHIVVSLAGPLSALFLLGLPAYLLEQSGTLTSVEAETIVAQAVWINIGWSLLNLVPILPLDGGQVFVSLAEMVNKERGRYAAEVVSVAIAAVLGVWAFQQGFIFGALLAAMFAGINVTSLSRAKTDRLGSQLHDAHRLLLAHRAADAEAEVTEVLAARPSGAVLQWSSELLGWTRLWQGDLAGCRGRRGALRPRRRSECLVPRRGGARRGTHGRRGQHAGLGAGPRPTGAGQEPGHRRCGRLRAGRAGRPRAVAARSRGPRGRHVVPPAARPRGLSARRRRGRPPHGGVRLRNN